MQNLGPPYLWNVCECCCGYCCGNSERCLLLLPWVNLKYFTLQILAPYSVMKNKLMTKAVNIRTVLWSITILIRFTWYRYRHIFTILNRNIFLNVLLFSFKNLTMSKLCVCNKWFLAALCKNSPRFTKLNFYYPIRLYL